MTIRTSPKVKSGMGKSCFPMLLFLPLPLLTSSLLWRVLVKGESDLIFPSFSLKRWLAITFHRTFDATADNRDFRQTRPQCFPEAARPSFRPPASSVFGWWTEHSASGKRPQRPLRNGTCRKSSPSFSPCASPVRPSCC